MEAAAAAATHHKPLMCVAKLHAVVRMRLIVEAQAVTSDPNLLRLSCRARGLRGGARLGCLPLFVR